MLTRRINAKSVCVDRCFDRCKELSREALILRISLFAYSCYEYLDLVVTSCGFSLSLSLSDLLPSHSRKAPAVGLEMQQTNHMQSVNPYPSLYAV